MSITNVIFGFIGLLTGLSLITIFYITARSGQISRGEHD
jgi:hypothetical protein